MRSLLIILLASTASLTFGQIKKDAFGFGPSQYWIIYDSEKSDYYDNLVVFIHGYGANNPGCYGKWIRNIISEGNIVLFPKYHNGMFIPNTAKYQERVDDNIDLAIINISDSIGVEIKKISFVTHSLGGIIAANLASDYHLKKKREVVSMMLVQPGFSLHKLGGLESYESVSPETLVLLITGEKDLTAGDKFAKHFYSTTPQIPSSRKKHLIHHNDYFEGKLVSSDHKEPICPDVAFDTGNTNPVVLGSYLVGVSNQVDSLAYWRLSNTVIQCSNRNDKSCVELFDNEAKLTYMGTWRNGEELKPMTIVSYSAE